MSRFTTLYKKGCLQQILIFLWIWSFSNLLRKTNFLTISVLLSEISLFWLKREVFSELARKCFKTTEKHSLVVCGSFCREKQFLLILSHFTALNKNGCLQQILNFLWICSFSNLLRKNLFDYFWTFFWDIFFLLKREFFSEFSQKCFKTEKSIV